MWLSKAKTWFLESLDYLNNLNSEFLESFQNFSDNNMRNLLFYGFAFIFIYFGVQKPLPVTSPPENYLSLMASQAGISSSLVINFVGFYEIFLGLLFVSKRIKLIFWPFMMHQIVTFLVLIMLPYSVFQPPWISFLGITFPVFLGSFSAFILKNLIFVVGFLLLFSREEINY